MLKWFTGLFTNNKTVESTADNLFNKDDGLLTQTGEWIGNFSFTDEERAEMNVKIGDKIAEFVGATTSENTQRSKTRREIAVLWIKTELAFHIMVAICLPWKKELAMDYLKLATTDVMLWGTGSIIVFFFGGYVWGAHVKRKGSS